MNFWFIENLPAESRPSVAQEFFRELVSPQEFPRGTHKIDKISNLLKKKKKTNEALYSIIIIYSILNVNF